ncbi:MAG TPA: lipid II flippase MurJ [Actinomycetota bacterium]|nr:lipid II flippase MurJ [Actinomycetota bacterium]
MSNSIAGSVWTVVSRLTGMIRILVVGAVLGATYLGNTYQTLNSLPNLVFYQLLAGTLFASLLVPPLVSHLDAGDDESARRLVGGFVAVLLLVAAGGALVLACMGPVIMRVLTLGADPATAEAQRRVGWILLTLFVPQILCYTIVGTSAAVMNAYGRFALAAAAPAIESLGMIAMLVAVAVIFGTGVDVATVSNQELLILGLGTTAAVALHATCQWLGARSAGMTVLPSRTWKDPEVRRVLRRILPTLGYTGISAIQLFAIMVVANTLAGGYVAFNVAVSFYYLPIAIVTWPLARALLPQLARLHHDGGGAAFRDELLRGITVATLVIVPISFSCLALARTLARVMAFGKLDTTTGVSLIAVALIALMTGVIFETWFVLGSYACYARYDVRSPLWAMAIKVGASVALMVPVAYLHGPAVLFVLGMAITIGSLTGTVFLVWRGRRDLPAGSFSPLPSFARTMLAGLVLIVVAYGVAHLLAVPEGHAGEALKLVAAGAAGLTAYALTLVALRAPEIGWLRAGLSRFNPLASRGA